MIPTNPHTTYKSKSGREYRVISLEKINNFSWKVGIIYLDHNSYGYLIFVNDILREQYERISFERFRELMDILFKSDKTLIGKDHVFECGDYKFFVPNENRELITLHKIKETDSRVYLSKFVNNEKIWSYEKLGFEPDNEDFFEFAAKALENETKRQPKKSTRSNNTNTE